MTAMLVTGKFPGDKKVLPAEVNRDLVAAELAVHEMLTALGIDLNSESMRDTPGRMVRAWVEILTPQPFNATTFPNDERYNQLVVQCDIPFVSVCEHHMLAFSGVAHVGYIPGERILGLSKLARIVEHFARRPQVQERLTQQIANWLQENLTPAGVGVVVSAQHSCMTIRGVRANDARTVTSVMDGALMSNPDSRREFMTLISNR
jgi:GTP cyclohydrolase IA